MNNITMWLVIGAIAFFAFGGVWAISRWWGGRRDCAV